MPMTAAARKRVLVFGPSLSAVSGVSTHVNMLMASALSRDYELIHFQVGSEGREESALRKLLRFLVSPVQLAGWITKNRPCAVHMNTSLDQKAYWRDLVYLVVARALGVKIVNQIHGGSLPQEFFRNSLLRWGLRRAFLASNSVIVLTSQELEAYKSFDARIRVHRIPNAIDVPELLKMSRAPNRNDPIRIVYVGRLVRTKGLFEAVDALTLLARQSVPFEFRVAGNGVDEQELKLRVQAAGLTDQVEFLGPVFGEAKERLWMKSDVFLFPTYHEGLPYALLEALAAGCVPVACPVGGIPDVMRDGVHGLFVPVQDSCAIADALLHLSKEREQLAAMSSNGRTRIRESYTMGRLEADFARIYREL